MRKSPLLLALLLVGLITVSSEGAETYPSRSVKLVVPYPAGGTGDMVARLVGEKLAAVLGQAIVVENRAGASGALGTRAVVTATPDGHTLLVGHTGEIAINPYWAKSVGYDPDKDLLPVSLAAIVPLALVASGKAPYATVAEMLKYAQTKSVSFASAGTATPGHFAGEVLKLKTGSNLTHVPYTGATPALNDLLGGHVDLFFSGFPAAMPQVTRGALKLLAVSSDKRSSVVPDVPTVAEGAGIPGFDLTLWMGFFAPHGTPAETVVRLNVEINKILTEPDFKKKLLDQGADVSPISVDRFASFVKAEGKKYREIINDANLMPP